MEKFSLLWPTGERSTTKLSKETIKDLSLEYLCESIMRNSNNVQYALDILSEINYDKDTILYRQEIFMDLYGNNTLTMRLKQAYEKIRMLDDMQGLTKYIDGKMGLFDLIKYLQELEIYVDAMLELNDSFENNKVDSRGFKELKQRVQELSESSGFRYLKEDIQCLCDEISQIKSITFGANVDSNLNITEMMLLSVNNYKHAPNKSILSKFTDFIREAALMGNGNLNVKNASEAMESLRMTHYPNSSEQDRVMFDLSKQMEVVLDSLVKKMRRGLKKYVDMEGYFILNIIKELEYILNMVEFFHRIDQSGYPLCRPEIADNIHNSLISKDFYNIKLAAKMYLTEEIPKEEIVMNDMLFSDEHNIFILTGPNRGGKTTFTQAIGLAMLFFSQGLFVPAKEFKASLVDAIHTHFPVDENETVMHGRLGEEAVRIREIITNISKNSLILLNETYSTTSFTEGLYLAEDLVKALKYHDVRCIYNTHMHELASMADKLNESEGEGKVASLVMGIQDGARSFKVQLASPENNSYAKDIAIKYGVTFEQMIKRNKIVV